MIIIIGTFIEKKYTGTPLLSLVSFPFFWAFQFRLSATWEWISRFFAADECNIHMLASVNSLGSCDAPKWKTSFLKTIITHSFRSKMSDNVKSNIKFFCSFPVQVRAGKARIWFRENFIYYHFFASLPIYSMFGIDWRDELVRFGTINPIFSHLCCAFCLHPQKKKRKLSVLCGSERWALNKHISKSILNVCCLEWILWNCLKRWFSFEFFGNFEKEKNRKRYANREMRAELKKKRKKQNTYITTENSWKNRTYIKCV